MAESDTEASTEEKRALSQDELELADLARPPGLTALSDREVSDLVSRLRDRRDRARDIGDRQGREARGKADPAGGSAATGNVGTLTKLDYLDAALERARSERERRAGAGDADADGPSQTELTEKARALKARNESESAMKEEGGAMHPNDPDADPGKKHLEDTDRNAPPSGAFEEAGSLPARERSRTRH